MSTDCSRSALMLNDEIPISYFLAPRPGMMPSNEEFWNSICTPSTWPMAVPRSTSKPVALPLSWNSFGG